MDEDKTCYVAITRLHGRGPCFSFIGAYGEQYRNYALISRRNGIEVVAEQSGVSFETVHRLQGFDEKGKFTDRIPLRDFVDNINLGKVVNVQEALSSLCRNL